MDSTLDNWGLHLNEQALFLLQRAENVAETQGIDTNILHILFIILTNPSLTTNKVASQVINSDRLRNLIADVQQKMRNDALYLDMNMYRMACLEIAQKQNIQINDALILLQLLEKSYTIEQLLTSHDIALGELKRSIQPEIHTLKRVSDTSSFFLPSNSGALNKGDIEELRQGVTRQFRISEQSVLAKIDHAMHSKTLNTVLGTLENIVKEGREQFIVFCGQNGSALDVLEQVLAYRLGLIPEAGKTPPHPSDVLHGSALWKISLNTLRDLYSRNHRLHPAVALSFLKQEALKAKAILLFTGLETYSKKSAVSRKIREQLYHTDGTCIVGCHTYYDRQPDEDEVKLGLDNVRFITPEGLNDKYTFINFIKHYHIPRWEERGYTVEEDSFDSLFVLEPGVWIDKQRKTFPYLGIGLVDDCANIVRFGETYVQRMAADARVALAKLLATEAPQADEEHRDRFVRMLEAAQTHVNELHRQPVVKRRENKLVITRAFIEAQLFCRNNSEFHFPGFFPWTVSTKS